MIDLSFKYSNMLKNVWLTVTYSTLTPIAIPMFIINIFLTYIVEKYLLLRRFNRPKRTNPHLHNQAIEYLEFTLVFLCIGNFFVQIYYKTIHNQNSELSI